MFNTTCGTSTSLESYKSTNSMRGAVMLTCLFKIVDNTVEAEPNDIFAISPRISHSEVTPKS